jgi:hypothetical protein
MLHQDKPIALPKAPLHPSPQGYNRGLGAKARVSALHCHRGMLRRQSLAYLSSRLLRCDRSAVQKGRVLECEMTGGRSGHTFRRGCPVRSLDSSSVQEVGRVRLLDEQCGLDSFWPPMPSACRHVATRAKPVQAQDLSACLAILETVAHAEEPNSTIPKNKYLPQTDDRRLDTIEARHPRVPEAVPATRFLPMSGRKSLRDRRVECLMSKQTICGAVWLA